MRDEMNIFRGICYDLLSRGQVVYPRDMMILELENYNYILPPFCRFMNFNSRNLNINYIKKEFLWYLKGDKFDASISKHAKMWVSLQNSDGSFNSNYGQYFFGDQNQFDTIIKILKADKDSRRASMLLLTKEHVCSDTKDVPCTYALNFRIRNNKLNMTVRMRSQDAIFGMGNDAPAFSFLHEMMLNALKAYYPDLEYGLYYHSADSFHVYQRHFDMVNTIVQGDVFMPVKCPPISGPDEVEFLRQLKFDTIPDKYQFTKWLNE